MDKDEILAKSRSENKYADEMELQITQKACAISRSFGLLLCVVLSSLASFVSGVDATVSNACWSICSGMNALEYWIKTFKLKRRSDWSWSIFWTVCFVGFSFFFILKLCE